jgi:23S rRNA (guanosine2251-2'-O)-methyltransferase
MTQALTFGLHAVESLLRASSERVLRLYVQEGRQDKKIEMLIQLAHTLSIPVTRHTKQTLDELTQEANHQGILAFCTRAKIYSEEDLFRLLQNLSVPPFLLILDGIQDPHNLGACLRSADAAGVHAVIAPKDKAVGLTPIVNKVASGAADVIPFIQVTNLARCLEKLKEAGIWIYGAAGDATQTLFKTNLSGPVAIVLGAEGAGLRRLTREHCDMLVKIPMQGSVPSLNVSVAAGVFLFEVRRQRS